MDLNLLIQGNNWAILKQSCLSDVNHSLLVIRQKVKRNLNYKRDKSGS